VGKLPAIALAIACFGALCFGTLCFGTLCFGALCFGTGCSEAPDATPREAVHPALSALAAIDPAPSATASAAASVDAPAEISTSPAASSGEPAHEAPPPEAGGKRHWGYTKFPGGVLMVPWSYTADDGTYDLLIHFHGQPRIVRESVERANLNALVAVVNLGEGSVRYKRPYRWRALYLELLHQIDLAASRRGIWHPRRHRIAVSAWSAGYGAVEKILRVSRGDDRPDAVLLLDGLHARYLEEQPGELDPASLTSFLTAAREAAHNERLFAITHSDYDPGGYVGAKEAADYLFRSVEGEAAVVEAGQRDLDPVWLPSSFAVVKKRLHRPMHRRRDRRTGDFRVQSFDGAGWANHRQHLLQMAATVLPELRERWRSTPER